MRKLSDGTSYGWLHVSPSGKMRHLIKQVVADGKTTSFGGGTIHYKGNADDEWIVDEGKITAGAVFVDADACAWISLAGWPFKVVE